jgi:glucokinase
MSRYSIGIDLGGTNLRAAAFDENGELLKKLSGSTPITEGPEAVIADMVRAASILRDEFGRDSLAGIGAGVPGNIDMRAGVVVRWGNVPSFTGYPTRDELSKQLNTSVILENDANAAAIGEHWMGAGRNADDFVMLTLGTGIGGGIIHNGKIIRGHIGMAGELGHITVVPNGNPCGCGNSGCVEKHAAATAIGAMAQLMRLGDDLSAYDVQILAEKGDERAITIWRTMGEHLGIALAILINVFNFPLYLIGGGASGGWDHFAPAMLAEVERRSINYRLTKATTHIERATLGGDAGLYGAARLPLLGDAI